MNHFKIICPVCGVVNAVNELPWDNNFPSQDICPCCGTHYGEDDWGQNKEEVKINHINLRKKWIKDGMQWKYKDEHSIEKIPKNWDPKDQLKNIPREFLDINENY